MRAVRVGLLGVALAVVGCEPPKEQGGAPFSTGPSGAGGSTSTDTSGAGGAPMTSGAGGADAGGGGPSGHTKETNMTGFDVIATRVIDVLDEAGEVARQGFVHIGRPVQEPTGEWAVTYRISGIGSEREFAVLGLDAVQTLQLVHGVIGSVLLSTEEARQGRLRWEGDSEQGYLGFPLPPEGPPSQK